MRKALILGVVLTALAALALVGCGQGEEKEAGGEKVSAEKVKQEAKEAVRAAVDYTDQQRLELQKKLNDQYGKLATKSDALLSQARAQATAGQEKARTALADLEAKLKAVQEKMKAFQNAGQNAWAKAKEELQQALDNLQQAYEKAKGELQKG